MAVSFNDKDIYNQKFNPRAHLDRYYSSKDGALVNDKYLEFVLKQLAKTFTAGVVEGETLIDIGTGLSIYQLLSACEVFKEIIVSDYSALCRQEFEKWLKKHPGTFDWSPVVRYVCDLEGQSEKSTQKEEKLRQRVKEILKCDVTQSQPLESSLPLSADCLLSSLCLEAACKDHDTYRRAIKNISTLLKPGGHLVMMGALEDTYYTVGDHRFSVLFYDAGFVRNALTGAGYIIKDFQVCPRPKDSAHSFSDYKGFFFVVACKETSSLTVLERIPIYGNPSFENSNQLNCGALKVSNKAIEPEERGTTGLLMPQDDNYKPEQNNGFNIAPGALPDW
ncbi:nicotinamide N-methyltransferase-like [Ambystoma mexicanum]|uniref:nicotinamide N-methyltransferase-like n=1 Tax=Ambystoma mexicanum TaxID=8296 RepID=UPI0037E8B02C